jgi:hypothetical protein
MSYYTIPEEWPEWAQAAARIIRNCIRWWNRSGRNKAITVILLLAMLGCCWWAFGADRYQQRWSAPVLVDGTWQEGSFELNTWTEGGFIYIQHVVCYAIDADGSMGCSVGSTIELLPEQAAILRKQLRRLLNERSVANGIEEVAE